MYNIFIAMLYPQLNLLASGQGIVPSPPPVWMAQAYAPAIALGAYGISISN